MNSLEIKTTELLFVSIIAAIVLLAGCATPPAQPPTITSKKECVGLTQDGVVTMLVERGKDRCEVNLSETLFFIHNPTCDINDPDHPPFKTKNMFKANNIKRLGDDDPECIPIGENCNDCVKWTQGFSPETVQYETSPGEYVTICYDENNPQPQGCHLDPNTECETIFCMHSVRGGNCLETGYECVPDEFQIQRALGDKCSAHEECIHGGFGMCRGATGTIRSCQP